MTGAFFLNFLHTPPPLAHHHSFTGTYCYICPIPISEISLVLSLTHACPNSLQ